MAKLKTEVKHQYHQEEGVGLRERVFANIDTLSKVGSMLAPVSNLAPRIPGARAVMEEALGISRERELPTFASESLDAWFEARGRCRVPPSEAVDQVLLFPDTYTNYIYPQAGKAAIRTLEAADVYVRIPDDVAPSGRAAFSTGMLDLARERAERNVHALREAVDDGWSVVFVEPSDAVMFQDEYRDLLDGPSVDAVADAAYGVMEYADATGLVDRLDVREPTRTLSYHGHCNQKATNKDHHAVGALQAAGYDVDVLNTTCCGMAGSFGYHEEHYDLSQAIGSLLFDAVEESPGDVVTAPGASCRSQLGDHYDDHPPHPVEQLDDALR
jgi:Fe-S oxidoreductase